MPYTPSEFEFLRDNPAAVEAASRLELTKNTELADLTTLRKLHGDNARALVELVKAQRTARKKIDGGATWMVDGPSVQQATPSPVADVRVRHLQAMGVQRVADVTCSVGTELAHLHGAGMECVGADLDMTRLRMARINVPDVPVVRADALRPVIDADVVVADPARRGSSGRIHRIDQLLPPLPDLFAAHEGREMAVKCAPGIDFADVAEWAGQIDVVSVGGDVKEACVYSRGLSVGSDSLVRRAVVLREEGELTLTSEMPDDVGDGPAGSFIFDVDGAIVRAGLVRHVAYQHGLWQLDPRIAYLTGDEVPSGLTGLRAFEVVEQAPLKKLKTVMQGLGATSVEILVRGVDVDPDQLRKKLKLKSAGGAGKSAWSVVITRVGSTAVAYVCRAIK